MFLPLHRRKIKRSVSQAVRYRSAKPSRAVRLRYRPLILNLSSEKELRFFFGDNEKKFFYYENKIYIYTRKKNV